MQRLLSSSSPALVDYMTSVVQGLESHWLVIFLFGGCFMWNPMELGIFPCGGHNNWNMNSIVERYCKAKEEPHNTKDATSEVKFWKREATNLRQQLHDLQENHRKLMGKELSGLGIRDLQIIENQLEMSLRGIRMKKDQILTEEIQELRQKGGLFQQEKMELCKKVNLMHEENMELHKKEIDTSGMGRVDFSAMAPQGLRITGVQTQTINLELSQPHQKALEMLPDVQLRLSLSERKPEEGDSAEEIPTNLTTTL